MAPSMSRAAKGALRIAEITEGQPSKKRCRDCASTPVNKPLSISAHIEQYRVRYHGPGELSRVAHEIFACIAVRAPHPITSG